MRFAAVPAATPHRVDGHGMRALVANGCDHGEFRLQVLNQIQGRRPVAGLTTTMNPGFDDTICFSTSRKGGWVSTGMMRRAFSAAFRAARFSLVTGRSILTRFISTSASGRPACSYVMYGRFVGNALEIEWVSVVDLPGLNPLRRGDHADCPSGHRPPD